MLQPAGGIADAGPAHSTALRDDTRWLLARRSASVDAGYSDIPLPFARIDTPGFAIEAHWNLAELLGYLRTWSAVKQWQRQHGRDPIALLEPELATAWGHPSSGDPSAGRCTCLQASPTASTARMPPCDELLSLRNLGKTSVQWLHASGIHTAADLRRLGR